VVAVLVAFTGVQRRSGAPPTPDAAQARTFPYASEPPDEQLESVLGATPHVFESRILRLRPAEQTRAPPVPTVGALLRLRRWHPHRHQRTCHGLLDEARAVPTNPARSGRLPQRPPLHPHRRPRRPVAKPSATTPTTWPVSSSTSWPRVGTCAQHHDAALNSALRHLPALGNRGSHKLMHEQCLSKRDVNLEGRLRASLDAEYQCQPEEREAEHQEAWQRMETELRRRAEHHARHTLHPEGRPRHGSTSHGTSRDVHRRAAVARLTSAAIDAAVRVAGPQPVPVDRQGLQREVDIRPPEAEDLTLPQAERHLPSTATHAPAYCRATKHSSFDWTRSQRKYPKRKGRAP
jgi:hypothetical protein